MAAHECGNNAEFDLNPRLFLVQYARQHFIEISMIERGFQLF